MGHRMSSRVLVVLFMVDVVVNVAIQLFFLQIQMRCFVLYGRSGCQMLVIFKVFVMLIILAIKSCPMSLRLSFRASGLIRGMGR